MVEYHFIGIGGIGMGKLASLLLSKGISVSGSDVVDNLMVKSLRKQGAKIFIGHNVENIKDVKNVVYSSAIKNENPEFVAAENQGCRILKRAQLLAELMKNYCSVTVAGAHGKTTTTSMIAHLFITAGLDPTVALGGVFQQGSYEETLGKGKYFVAELDESDGSFLFFNPDISVITNIDFEHVDYYGDWDSILKSYDRFISQTSDGGVVIACGDDQRLMFLLKDFEKQVITYGLKKSNDLYAQDISFEDGKVQFSCWYQGELLGDISMHILGNHNVVNALACISSGIKVGLSFEDIAGALASYRGVKRRFELKGKWNDIMLLDDYAHHPTEIKATLKAVKLLNHRRIIAIFQPHRYTRTKFLWDDFIGAFQDVDRLLVTDIYAASEKLLENTTAERLCAEIENHSRCQATYLQKGSIVQELERIVQPGDIVITLGAGDITRISEEIVQRFKEKFSVSA